MWISVAVLLLAIAPSLAADVFVCSIVPYGLAVQYWGGFLLAGFAALAAFAVGENLFIYLKPSAIAVATMRLTSG